MQHPRQYPSLAPLTLQLKLHKHWETVGMSTNPVQYKPQLGGKCRIKKKNPGLSVIIMITFGPLHNDIIIHCQTCKISELISSSVMHTASCTLMSLVGEFCTNKLIRRHRDSQNAHLNLFLDFGHALLCRHHGEFLPIQWILYIYCIYRISSAEDILDPMNMRWCRSNKSALLHMPTEEKKEINYADTAKWWGNMEGFITSGC